MVQAVSLRRFAWPFADAGLSAANGFLSRFAGGFDANCGGEVVDTIAVIEERSGTDGVSGEGTVLAGVTVLAEGVCAYFPPRPRVPVVTSTSVAFAPCLSPSTCDLPPKCDKSSASPDTIQRLRSRHGNNRFLTNQWTFYPWFEIEEAANTG